MIDSIFIMILFLPVTSSNTISEGYILLPVFLNSLKFRFTPEVPALSLTDTADSFCPVTIHIIPYLFLIEITLDL
jgi:hypothetical protein